MKTKFGPKLAGFDLSLISELRKDYDFFEVAFNGKGPSSVELSKMFPSEKFVVHAPHHQRGVNLSVTEESNIYLVEAAVQSARVLNASKVIVHPGLGGDKKILISNLSRLSEKASENGIKIIFVGLN